MIPVSKVREIFSPKYWDVTFPIEKKFINIT
jgi:hypothetical protein